MSATLVDSRTGALHAPPLARSVERFRAALLWLTGFAGAFVFMEPSPYEVASVLTILVFALTGLQLRASLMPLAMMLVLYNIGFTIAVIPLLSQNKPLTWVLVSWYLGATAFCLAAILTTNTYERLKLLLAGYLFGALLSASIGVLAYFKAIPGAGLFLKFDRAQGTFNDPNVFGAFLVLPLLVTLQRVLDARGRRLIWPVIGHLLLVIGLLLSFSRAAWGQYAFAAALLVALTFITTRSSRERMRIVGLTAAGAMALLLFVAALLSVDRVAALFTERASFDQSYDVGHMGRFGRHLLGFMLALDKPFGIGPLQFATIFPEDPHNAYLNAFMSGGWISGISYFVLVSVTVVIGFRHCFVATPWRLAYLAVYAAFLGVVAESVIIDSDHWRHYFLLLGAVWGLVAAGRVSRAPQTHIGAYRAAVVPPLASASGRA